MFRLVLAFSLCCLTDSLDSAAFHRVLNKTGLTSAQIDQLALVYNNGTVTKSAKEDGLEFINTLSSSKLKSKVKTAFMKLWKNENLLRKLEEASLDNVDVVVNGTLMNKILEHKKEAEAKYGGDFAKSQLDTVRFISSQVSPDVRQQVEKELNEPLQALKGDKIKKLKEAIQLFQTKNSKA